jgi:predicted Rdx family selenoprotein
MSDSDAPETLYIHILQWLDQGTWNGQHMLHTWGIKNAYIIFVKQSQWLKEGSWSS